jgi:leucyl aminopeptidase
MVIAPARACGRVAVARAWIRSAFVRVLAASDPLNAVDAGVLAVGVFAGEPPEHPEAAELVARGEARDRARHLAVTHVGPRPLIVAGLGPRDAFDAETARRVAAVVLRRARELGGTDGGWSLAWELPAGADPEIAEALVVGTALAAYSFTRYRAPDPDEDSARLERLTVAAVASDATRAAIDRAAVLVAAQNRARDLGNTPPNELTPTALARYASELADRHDGITCEILDEEQLRERGMGAFAAVAQGSPQPAKLITLRYEGPGSSAQAPRHALIGKAVTFDSGGLNLKPGPSMTGMKFDMAGGAVVIETVSALAELAAPVRVLAVIGATENMTGGAAMKPGDVLRAYDGTTIEMKNADAEGRLVLADCITHARREGCDAIVDIATLTGGVTVALGSVYAGVMANDDALAQRLLDCGTRTGELLWRLPLHPRYAEMVKSPVAQISNLPHPPRQASAVTAAEFLHHFAGDTPWAHLDIAGVADDVKAPYYDAGGTGFGVRLLAELALGS